MGLFQKQQPKRKSPEEEAFDIEQHFFDENFREELRNHGRLYFNKIIKENGELFKQDLAATLTQINAELKDHVVKHLEATFTKENLEIKEHVTKKLDEQFLGYSKEIKAAQDQALQSLSRSAQAMEQQYQQLSATLQKNIATQEALITNVSEENKARITVMTDAQDQALQSLNKSAKAMEEQYQQLSQTIEKSVADQKATMVSLFEQNMARIIEHYLLGALGDQFDMKAQMPLIIKQMEANKQAISDDMKL